MMTPRICELVGQATQRLNIKNNHAFYLSIPRGVANQHCLHCARYVKYEEHTYCFRQQPLDAYTPNTMMATAERMTHT